MPLIPNRFLFRVSHPCPYVAGIPDDDDDLFSLPDACKLSSFAELDDRREFADVRMAWNENGLALQVEVRGKDRLPEGDIDRPRHSDGVSLWIDTRESRTSHRASRFCHQFHLLPRGGGEEKDQAVFGQSKINRALADAPLAAPGSIALRGRVRGTGYRLAAFLPADALTGFDPAHNPRLGIFYVVRDAELGEQALGASTDLPYAEDPTLWGVLELVREEEG
jgi:hypothetical protein